MYARLGEVIGLDASIAVTLAAHQAIGLKVRVWVSGAHGGTGQLAPLETTSSPSPDPSFQAPVRGRRLHGACLHGGWEVIPPTLGLLPMDLSMSALLLVLSSTGVGASQGRPPRPTAQPLGGFAQRRNRGGGAPPRSAVAPTTQLGSGEAAGEAESHPEAVAGHLACPCAGAP